VKRLLVFLLFNIGFGVSPAQAGGMNILQEQCASCHALYGPAPQTLSQFKARQGPDFFYAGNKYRKAWLVQWLQNPKRIRPAGIFYRDHIKPGEKRDEIDLSTLKPHIILDKSSAESVAEALMQLKANSELIAGAAFVPAGASLGEMSFDKFYGCLGCHQIEPGYGGLSGPEVYTAARRLTPEYMSSFIANPQAWDPKTLMPKRDLQEGNIRNLVNYMLDLSKEDWDEK